MSAEDDAPGKFFCKECKEEIIMDFSAIQEEELKEFKDVFESVEYPEKESNKLELSFVVVNKALQDQLKAQNAQNQSMTPILESKTSDYSNNEISLNENNVKMDDNFNGSNNDIISDNIDISKEKDLSISKSEGFSESLNVLEEISNICKGLTSISHPLCSDCTSKIIKNLELEHEELKRERQTYADYIFHFENESKLNENTRVQILQGVKSEKEIPTRPRNDKNVSVDITAKRQQYQQETIALEKKLIEIKKERLALQFELNQLELESERMNEFEEMFFCDANDFWYSIENLSYQHSSVRQKMRHISNHLDMMKRTNVFDDAFHIYFDGHFGTINGLRLGRLQSVQVDWEEINTGFGQCILLLDVLAQKCNHKNFKFDGYELFPMGSSSYIKEKKKSGKHMIHQLYGSTGLFGYRQCDKALECLLQCIKQFADWITIQNDENFQLRYEIKGATIGDAKTKKFLKIGFAQQSEEEWTQALKYMVIDLKFLLAWVTRSCP